MSKKIRLFFWFTQAFFSKHKRIIITTSVLGILFFLLTIKVVPLPPLPVSTERIGLIGKYTIDNLPPEVINKLSQGLTAIAQDGSAVPALVQDWEVSNEGTAYTFRIKDGFLWQDGTRVLASQMEFNFSDVQKEIVDDKTVKFILKEPFTPFPLILAKPVFKKELLGVGPFKVVWIKKKGGIVEGIKIAGPNKNIVYKFYPTLEIAVQAFKVGEIDVLQELLINPFSDDWRKRLRQEKGVKNNQYVAIFLNNNNEFLKEKAARQALAYATPRLDSETRAFSPINPDSWAFNSEVKKYDFNPEKAKELLGKNKQEAAQIKLTLSTTQPFLTLAEEIKKNWEEILGIRVDVVVINAISPDFQALLAIQEIPADPDQYPLWHSTQPQNFTGYKSPRVDKILEDARKEPDAIKRKELYADFQKFLLEDCPVIFLYQPGVYTIKR